MDRQSESALAWWMLGRVPFERRNRARSMGAGSPAMFREIGKMSSIAIGIDVGGPPRGFHAVALDESNEVTICHECEVAVIARWCRHIGPAAIAVDSPCGWSVNGRSRHAERLLRAERINCFSTPNREVAEGHPSDFYGWMLNGEALYSALRREMGKLRRQSGVTIPVVETFPHAVAWALNGGRHPGHSKRVVRRRLLELSGVRTRKLRGLDYLDAALCAVAARSLLEKRARFVGGGKEGAIVLPVTVNRSSAKPRRS